MDFLIGTLIGVVATVSVLCILALADKLLAGKEESRAKPPMWLGGYRWRRRKKKIGLFVGLGALSLFLIGTAIGGYLLGGAWGAIGGPLGVIIVLSAVVFLSRSPA